MARPTDGRARDSGSKNVTAYNNVNLTSSSSFSLVRDVTAPTGGALTVNERPRPAVARRDGATGSYPINPRPDYNVDSQWGVASSTLTAARRRSAPSRTAARKPTKLWERPAEQSRRGVLPGHAGRHGCVGNAGSISTTCRCRQTPPPSRSPPGEQRPLQHQRLEQRLLRNGLRRRLRPHGGLAGASASAALQGLYWNGSSFSSSAQTFSRRHGRTSRADSDRWVVVPGLELPRGRPVPGKGARHRHAREHDRTGVLPDNDVHDRRAPPPAPTITDRPAHPTNDSTRTSSFTDARPASRIDPQDFNNFSSSALTPNGSSGSAAPNDLANSSPHVLRRGGRPGRQRQQPTLASAGRSGTGSKNFTIAGSPLAG